MSLDLIVDFKKYSSIKIGPKVKIKIINEIVDIQEYLIGGANNLLISPNPPKLAILGDKFRYIEIKKDLLIVGAKTKSSELFSFAKKNNIAGFEFLANLPGTIGGLAKMNAGMKEQEIFNLIKYIKTKSGEILKKDLDYGYRYLNIDEAIFEVGFELKQGFDKEKLIFFRNLRKNQPNLPSAGSCFKNGAEYSAGKLLDLAGFKGKIKNNIGFSKIHANFLVNYGNGNFYDAIDLINEAKKEVFKKFNKNLENEIIIL